MEDINEMPAWANQLLTIIQQQITQQTQQQLDAFEQRLSQPTLETTQPETITPIEEKTTSVRRKDRLPNVQEFEGQRSEFRAWKYEITAKLAIDLKHEDKEVQAWYIYSRLKGKARQQIAPWLNTAESQNSLTPESLLYQLELAYNDSESIQRATRKLNIIRQGTKPFSLFIAEFERTLIDAGGSTWDDQAKKAFLTNTLSTGLQQALIPLAVPHTYREYCDLLQRVSYNIEVFQKQNYSRQTGYTPAPAPALTPPIGNNTMDWEPTPIVTATTERKEAKWASTAIIDERRKKGACFRCGNIGHKIHECRLLPATRPVQTVAIAESNKVEELIDLETEKE